MDNRYLKRTFSELSTPVIADSCMRMGLPIRAAPAGIAPVVAGSRIAGHALPVKHYGSVDIFLEAMGSAKPGDILIVDNQGRTGEGCLGDLTVLEAETCGLGGIIVWGCHRDTAELIRIGFPVFSYGASSPGPRRLDPPDKEILTRICFGDVAVTRTDIVFADADGVLFAPMMRVEELLSTARAIREAEHTQAGAIRAGKSLRSQLRFGEYLNRRLVDPGYTFRSHLRKIGAAIEE